MSSKSPRQPGWGSHRELGTAKPHRTLPALLQLPPVLQTSRRQHGNKIAEKLTRNRSEVSPSASLCMRMDSRGHEREFILF